jgi:photosystem II stability/assembly factor-like uncharacterized protein
VVLNDSTPQDSLIVDKSFGKATQTHRVTVLDSNGCKGRDTVQLSLFEASIDSSITTRNDTLIANNTGASSYRWLSCDNGYNSISGAKSRKFYPSTDGDYAAVVLEGSCRDTSACGTSLPNSPWNSMGSGVPGTLNSVHFVDSLNGWFVTASGQILHTSDAGNTWKLQLDTSVAFHSIDLGSDSSGAVVGSNGTILTTENGGRDWKAQSSGVSHDLLSVHFVDPNNGWAVGRNGTAIHSSDSGATWNSQPDGNNVDLNAVFFHDRKLGWIAGNDGQMVRTYDGGGIWTYLTSGTSENLNDVRFVNDTVGWTVGDSGTILLSEDAGDNWTAQNSGTTEDLEAVHFVNDSVGWVVGANGTILHTEDGRSAWSFQADEEPDGLKDVQFLGEGNGWAAGEKGTLLNFGRRTPDDPTSIEEEQKEALVKVYPNPVDERLRIEHRDVDGELTFTLFNKLGQRLKIDQTNASEGRSSLQVNGLEPGIYFLKIEEEEGGNEVQEQVQKIVVK